MGFVEELFSLKEKVAVITGGAGILGSEIAKGFGKAGAKVIICDIKNYKEVAEKLKDEEKIEIEGLFIDVLKIEKIKETHDEIIKKYSKVDILVNAAGGNIKEATTSKNLSFFELPLSGLEKVIALNLFGGAILPSQIFGKSMVKNEKGGVIINISSMNAFRQSILLRNTTKI